MIVFDALKNINYVAASNDFATSVEPLTFQSGSMLECVSISITNDTILENSEEFSVQLTTTDSAVNLNATSNSATVTITDNDREFS